MRITDDILYSDFNSVEDVKRFINESKKDEVKKDHVEVQYAEYKEGEYKNIFKHIIIFTNDRNPEKNKTLKNLFDAVRNLKESHYKIIPQIHVFVADEMTFKSDEDNILSITDGDEEYVFDDESNIDTLVFSRLGVQGEDNCEHIVQLLQDRGFLVLNPVRYSELASNKYDTACLLQKGNIPQPNFCLMTKDILYDEEQYKQSMKSIYKEWSEDVDKNKDLDFVVKILDGHGGTGVFTCDGKKLYAILQTIFAIDKNRKLIIQRKEEGDGGDIRVHVLTLKDEQKILACMKRVKIGGDFRSNISLGASAEEIKLTPEQEQIALKTAKLSKLPWCAVDIMPLVKGSNPEVGDNVVLEINASPGTDGISDVIGYNFINILLNELDNPKKFFLQDKTAGYLETTSIKIEDGDKYVDILAKLDTGNGAIASHMEVGGLKEGDGRVEFEFMGKKYKKEIKGYSKAITGTQQHNRPIINISELKLGLRKIYDVPMALVEDRNGKSSNILLNRQVLGWMGYNTSSSNTHMLTPEMDKIKIV